MPRISMPRLSVIVPFTGDERRFDTTLVSILQHRHKRCEVVIAHDDSWIDHWDIAGEEGVTLAAAGPAKSVAAPMVQLLSAGLQTAAGEFVGICQPGITFAANWQPQVLSTFSDPAVASVTPTIVDARRPDTIIAAGVTNNRQQNRELVGEECTLASTTAGRLKPIGPTLWSAFYRRTFLDAIGGFDATVDPMYLDLDLALSIQSLGLRNAWSQNCHVAIDNCDQIYEQADAAHGASAQRALHRFGRSSLVSSMMPAVVESVKSLVSPGTIRHLLQRRAAAAYRDVDLQFAARLRKAAKSLAANNDLASQRRAA